MLELLQPSCHDKEVLSENGANLEENSTETERETRSSMLEPLNQTVPETSPTP